MLFSNNNSCDLRFFLDNFEMLRTNNEYCSHTTSYLPIRSTWARAVLNKIENDRCLENLDRNQWYSLSNNNLLDEKYRKYFHQFHEDEETTIFIKQSQEKSDNIPLQIIQSFLTTFLTLFITRTSGILLIPKQTIIRKNAFKRPKKDLKT